MGSDWKRLIGAVITGLIFSFLVTKLISIATAFKDHNLNQLPAPNFGDPVRRQLDPVADDNSVTAKNDSLLKGGDASDDWEEVGSTELDNDFGSSSDQVQGKSSDWIIL